MKGLFRTPGDNFVQLLLSAKCRFEVVLGRCSITWKFLHLLESAAGGFAVEAGAGVVLQKMTVINRWWNRGSFRMPPGESIDSRFFHIIAVAPSACPNLMEADDPTEVRLSYRCVLGPKSSHEAEAYLNKMRRGARGRPAGEFACEVRKRNLPRRLISTFERQTETGKYSGETCPG